MTQALLLKALIRNISFPVAGVEQIDQVVNAALLLVDGIYGAKEGVSRLPAGQATYRTTCQDFRILDRYQVGVSTCS